MVIALQDIRLLAKIEGGDLIVKEVKYHLKCLVSLTNRYKRIQIQQPNNVKDYQNECRVFVELTNYMKYLGLFFSDWLIFVCFTW